ncbi:Nop-domain-containing protein [Ascobolus immersus RN42]|uniref:Nucleolar protein 58 n=1 Tax=Ascobolus immersus RN42 TaxID=1160509 RepID=A0A3N4IGH3_ASCIM|nr:Nop-domain-containing protein [Ascobolus immersus RN42]
MLQSLLDEVKDEKKASLIVADSKLGSAIAKLPGLKLEIVSDSSTDDVYRAIREHLSSLIPGLTPEDVTTMSLGLSHSLSRHKLKFSADKVDTMIVQAIALLDELDKELNNYAMRVKEWYGWHFPEMSKIINDNQAYARVIRAVGMRQNIAKSDLSEILPEEIEAALKAAAEISMGTEITEDDISNISDLATQVIDLTEYRAQLAQYLSARMAAIAPNLTQLVGELVGARLIAHAGSLINLAKSPASTIQILGAEKALFRALKTKHDTPKYGLIYHASLIGQATGRNKGKIARMLATKTALGMRIDALTEEKDASGEFGNAQRFKLENKVRALEGKPLLPKGTHIELSKPAQTNKWEIKEAKKYNAAADAVMEDAPAAADKEAVESVKRSKDVVVHPDSEMDVDESEEESEEEKPKKEKKEKKEKKDKKRKVEEVEEEEEKPAKKEKKEKKEKKDKKDKSEKKEKKDKSEKKEKKEKKSKKEKS